MFLTENSKMFFKNLKKTLQISKKIKNFSRIKKKSEIFLKFQETQTNF